jgi:hypothetical protein
MARLLRSLTVSTFGISIRGVGLHPVGFRLEDVGADGSVANRLFETLAGG